MNFADYAILAVLGLSILMGLWRGLVNEVMALLVWLAAFWAAWAFGAHVAAWFDPAVSLPSARVALGYGLCFVVVLVAGAIVRFVLQRLIEGTGLTGTDRLLGMVFGLARGAFIVTLVVMLAGFTPFPRDPWWSQSEFLPAFRGSAEWLGNWLPDDVRRHFALAPGLVAATAREVPGVLKDVVPAAAAAPVGPARAGTAASLPTR